MLTQQRFCSYKNLTTFALCWLLSLPFACAQNNNSQNITLRLVAPSTFEHLFEKLDIKNLQTFPDTLSTLRELKRVIAHLQTKGYVEATLDSLRWQATNAIAYLHFGKKYEWATLKNGNVQTNFLEKIGIELENFEGKTFHIAELKQLTSRLLEQAENNGYPFAMVWLDSIRIEDEGKISAKIFMDNYRNISIEALKIEGDIKLSEVYLRNYLEIELGSPYNQSRIKDIVRRLRNLPFVELVRPPSVSFRGDVAIITVFLKKKKASQFDFIVGVLPRTVNPTNPELSRRLLVTASLNAHAQNLLGAGERVFVKFQQLQPLTQSLDLQLSYPYIFGLPFGVEGKFSLYKRDTAYLDLDSDLGVLYLLGGNDYLKAFWNRRSTTILSVDGEKIVTTKKLPDRLDTSYSSFGLEYQQQRLDYRFNPRKGWNVWLRGAAGFKTIEKNNLITSLRSPTMPDFKPETLYDSIQARSVQYRFLAKTEAYLRLANRSVLKIGVQGGGIFSKNSTYANELLRLGGNQLLRGFDEEAIFASSYLLSTLEYRFMIDTNSYLYTFGDYAYVETNTTEIQQTDRPLGLGAGITFETRAGIFGISYAIGRRFDNPFDFRAAKIHFGYVNYF